MRTSPFTPARFGTFFATVLGIAGLVGCGGGSGERTASSSSPAAPPTHVASVDVTYYYLPG